MNAIRQVLVGTDFSKQARIAITQAARICQKHGADLKLLHVIDELPPEELVSREELLESTRQRLHAEIRAAVSVDIAYSVQVETGKGFVSIIHCARQMKADLIVVGAHGEHSFRDHFLGTTAEKLVRKASFPVLVVKQPPRTPYQYRRVLVPTDFSDESRKALCIATILAPEANVDLLHVYGGWGESQLGMAGKGQQELERFRQRTELWAMAAMDEWRQSVDLDKRHVEQHLRKGHPASVIRTFSEERKHDLVVMGTRGKSALPHILLGSVAEHALRTVPCDILVVRAGDVFFQAP